MPRSESIKIFEIQSEKNWDLWQIYCEYIEDFKYLDAQEISADRAKSLNLGLIMNFMPPAESNYLLMNRHGFFYFT